MAILTLNSGSTSLKFGLYDDRGEEVLFAGSARHLGTEKAVLAFGEDEQGIDAKNAAAALPLLLDRLHAAGAPTVTAVGHRIVHGGPHLVEHCLLTPEVLATLEHSVHFAPLHIPPAIALVRAAEQALPQAAHYACFDTAFHQTLPPAAYTYALPLPYREAGVRRYGFHGLSYESLVHTLGDMLPARTVAMHLGGGSSVCALLKGRSVRTSMGVSPAGGVPMGTRAGDLDPGVVLLLAQGVGPALRGLAPAALEHMLNRESGMRALAGEDDMQRLLARTDADAALALTIYADSLAATVAGYATALGGLDAVIFTGGIGEHAGHIREAVCARLGIFGVRLAATPAGTLHSAADSAVRVYVLPADEDGEIARHVARLRRMP